MRLIIFLFLYFFSTSALQAQSVFDTASCGGNSRLQGFTADKIFARSQQWVTSNIKPLTYTENETNGSILITSLEDYNAQTADKLPKKYSGKFQYTFVVQTRDSAYSYDFINVKFIPAAMLEQTLRNPEESNSKPIKMKRRTWEKITRSAHRQLQEKGRKYDAYMQACK